MTTVATFEALSSPSGVIVVAVFALISAFALAYICGRTIRLGVKVLLRRDDEDISKIPEMLFFCTQLGHYATGLVLSNVFITLSGLIEFSWISGGVSAGPTCQAQAIVEQIGLWANCYFTVAHGVHTCNSLILRLHQPRWLSPVVIAIGWGIALVAGLAPLHQGNVYGPSGVSCSVASGYRKEIFILQALPIILAAIGSILVYCLIFLVLGGKLGISGTDKLRKLSLKAHRRPDEFEEYRRFISTIIRTMFWFPFVFVMLLLPFCITRLMMSAGSAVPYAFTVFSYACFYLLGFVNVGLLVSTYRVVSPIFGSKQDPTTLKTFGNDASGESPVRQRPPSTFSSQGPVTIPSVKSTLPRTSVHFAYHSRSDSSSSADSTTGLLKHIVPPAELSRQINDGTPMSQKRKSELEITMTPPSEAMGGPGLMAVCLSPAPPRILPMAEQPEFEHLVRQSTLTFGKNARDLVFKSKAPPALNIPSSMEPPSPLFTQEIVNKSTTLAVELGIPPSPRSPATRSMTSTINKGKGKAPPPPFTPIRVESNVQRPRVVLEVRPFDLVGLSVVDEGGIMRANSRLSFSSSVSGASVPDSVDNDSDYSLDSSTTVIRPTTIISLASHAPESDDGEDTMDSDAPPTLSPHGRRAQRATTRSSVQSRESMQTFIQPLEMETHLAMKELKVRKGQKSVGATPGRQAPAGPRAANSARPVKAASKLSARFTKTLAPTWSAAGTRNLAFKMVLAPNDSAV